MDTPSIVHTIDLHFQGLSGAIASYLVPHNHGAVLVECGPGSTLDALQTGIQHFGFTLTDISDILLTHIHLDHAGASGWLAQQGARIHVHPVGAPHLRNPERLLASAERIYGDLMGKLWGEFLPVPNDKLNILQDKQILEIENLQFRVLDTPGHADHHFIYILDDLCFSGDIGGVRLQNRCHLRLPMPPPEFHLEKWFASLEILKREPIQRIAPTHFGIFSDAGWHLRALEQVLKDTAAWIENLMPTAPDVDTINTRLSEWSQDRALADGVPDNDLQAYYAANPTWMSGYGIQRYWNKYRQGS